jgi:hypothetical protein
MTDKTLGPRSETGGPPGPPGDHPYNAPDLSPLAFLLAVVHDHSVDINLRIKAAEAAAPYVAPRQGIKWEDRDPLDQLTIIIGGIPDGASVSVGSGSGEGQTENHSQNRSETFQPDPRCRDENPRLN